ncbi:hypothetical protein J2T14_000221 [Paenibacillus harenae]|nr:hypothetical protein [Paenibacillus harenae]
MKQRWRFKDNPWIAIFLLFIDRFTAQTVVA